jgi:hypothetical protein
MNSATTNSHASPHHWEETGDSRVGWVCKQILNDLMDFARRPIERRRLAALSLRQLEDIGMTVAERDGLLR